MVRSVGDADFESEMGAREKMASNREEIMQKPELLPERTESGRLSVNVGDTERLLSTIGGGALALYGLTRGSFSGIALALAGGALIYRGVTGHCNLYEAMGVNTATGTRSAKSARVEKSVTVNRPVEEVYRFWRNLENLPRVMSHLESVEVKDDKRSLWVAKAPAGTSVEWDAEITNERPNELISWRSLPGADVENSGTVSFRRTDGGTEIRVTLEYTPPGGALGATVARLFGENPEQQLEEDLQRFKREMEATGDAARRTTV